MGNVFYLFLLGWVLITESTMCKNSSNEEIKNQTKFHGRKQNRFKRSENNCAANDSLIYDERAGFCCKKCPEGQYLESSCTKPGQEPTCRACDHGTYLEYPNYVSKCRICLNCHSGTQSTVRNCSATANAKCKCKKGRYEALGGQCLPCTICTNRTILKNCSQYEDTECGLCLPGFYEEEDRCHSCSQLSHKVCEIQNNVSCSKTCGLVDPQALDLSVGYIITGALLALLLPILACIIHHRKRKRECFGKHEITLIQDNLLMNCNEAAGKSEDPLHSAVHNDHRCILLNGRTLYDIINAIPVKRWKEFMRTVEFPDKEIEIVEMEVNSFRDQQYEMLRRWCQIKAATPEMIYVALDRMNLSGCLDDLKIKMESYT